MPDDNPTGIYERTFELPAGWAERRVVLHVGAAESVLIVRLNGEDVGSARTRTWPRSSTSPSYVRPGANTLRLRVVKWSDATYVEDQDQWWHGGITRSVFLYATGPIYLADMRAVGRLAEIWTGTLDLASTSASPAAATQPGWRVEARVPGPVAEVR